MSREQNVPVRNNRNATAISRINVKPSGANAPRLNNGARNLEAPNNTRRNNTNHRGFATRNNRNNVSINMASNGEPSDPEVVVHTPSESPANTAINVNRGFRNNATPNRLRNNRVNVVVNQGPPNNATRINVAPEAEVEEETLLPPGNEMAGGRRRKSRKSKSKRSHRSRRR